MRTPARLIGLGDRVLQVGHCLSPADPARTLRGPRLGWINQHGQNVLLDIMLRLPEHHFRGQAEQFHRLGHIILSGVVLEVGVHYRH